MDRFKFDRMVSDESHAAIGRVVVEFQGLEAEIKLFVQWMIPAPQRFAQIITAELSFKNSCALVSSLFRELHEEKPEMEQLSKLVRRAIELEEQRNVIMHSQWFGEHRVKTTARLKRGIQFDFVKHDDQQLNDLAEQLNKCAQEWLTFSRGVATRGLDAASSLPTWSARSL